MNKTDRFKVTPEMLRAIGINLSNWPSVPQALKARAEADIVQQQALNLFISNAVQWVLQELERRHSGEGSEMFIHADMFNYGYIMGIRAERARRKADKNEN